MGYETLFKDHLASVEIESIVPLLEQRKYAILSGLLAFVFITFAIIISYSKKNIFIKFLLYTLLSIIGSLFLSMCTIFSSNSFGVYI